MGPRPPSRASCWNTVSTIRERTRFDGRCPKRKRGERGPRERTCRGPVAGAEDGPGLALAAHANHRVSYQAMMRVHGSCVAVDGAGVLFRGPSGCGKSDLCLRLIDDGAVLVADDQVLLARGEMGLVAACPPAISGRLEVRGLGIVRVPNVAMAAVLLVVDLVPPGNVDRLPRPRRCRFEQVDLPLIALAPFEPSAAAKVRLALRSIAVDSAAFGRPGLRTGNPEG